VLNNLHHQAAMQFDRVITLAPRNLAARIWLAQLYVVSRLPAQALQIINEIRSHPALLPVTRTNRTEMLFVEASAHLANGDLKSAESVVQAALEKYPNDPELLDTASQVFMNYKCYSNALATINQQLKVSTNNLVALVNKGYACIQIGAFEQAIPPLTRALDLDTNNYRARFDLAIANLKCDQLDAAQHHYEVLQKTFTNAHQIFYGLAETAWRKKDTNAAIRNYQLYLANAATNTPEANIVFARLKELKPGSR
jgi:tetratricopeptide (TPR) repeat protein